MITKLEKTGHFVNLDRLNRCSTIIDAGACLGKFIDDMRSLNRTRYCMIYAIEPNIDNIEHLRSRDDANLIVWPCALAGDEDELTFYNSHQLGWGSTQRPPPQPITSYPVKTIKINEIFKTLGISRIDYLKMVIEGDEKRVLNTMSQKTAEKIKQIAVEFHNQYGATRNYVVDRFKKLGFEINAEHYKEVLGERK